MDKIEIPISLRWSDMDPNFHLRHSVYYDLAAQMRTEVFVKEGITPKYMMSHNFSPVLLREEALFHKEVIYGDKLTITAQAFLLKRNFSRFGVRHHLMRGDVICATITIEGAFIDIKARKITEPPELVKKMMDAFPKANDFNWVE